MAVGSISLFLLVLGLDRITLHVPLNAILYKQRSNFMTPRGRVRTYGVVYGVDISTTRVSVNIQ